jgi:hypothetical protein
LRSELSELRSELRELSLAIVAQSAHVRSDAVARARVLLFGSLRRAQVRCKEPNFSFQVHPQPSEAHLSRERETRSPTPELESASGGASELQAATALRPERGLKIAWVRGMHDATACSMQHATCNVLCRAGARGTSACGVGCSTCASCARHAHACAAAETCLMASAFLSTCRPVFIPTSRAP